MGNLIEIEQVTDTCVVTVNRKGITIQPLPGKTTSAHMVLPASFLGKISQVINGLAEDVDRLTEQLREPVDRIVEKEVMKYVPLGSTKKKNLFVAGLTLGKNLSKGK